MAKDCARGALYFDKGTGRDFFWTPGLIHCTGATTFRKLKATHLYVLISRFHPARFFGANLLKEHVVQWHPTILTKLALTEQRLLNSYSIDIASRGGKNAMYQEDDFIVRLVGCELDSQRNCEKEMDPFYQQWKKAVTGSK